jgi:hypothetical protein
MSSPELRRGTFSACCPQYPGVNHAFLIFINPRMLSAFSDTQVDRLTQLPYEACIGFTYLRPADLHLSFKVTWSYESLHKTNLLLDPRMNNSGRGIFTPLFHACFGVLCVRQRTLRLSGPFVPPNARGRM